MNKTFFLVANYIYELIFIFSNSKHLFFYIFLFVFTSCSLFENDESYDEGIQIPNTEVFLPLGFNDFSIQSDISPDGQTIVYINYYNDSIPHGIYTLDLVTYQRKLLVAGLGLGNPDWSTNGKWIVYNCFGNIYKIKFNGDSLSQLTNNGSNFFPSWKPNDDIIMFISENSSSGTWFMRSDGTQMTYIYNLDFYSWHPSGQNLVGVKQKSPYSDWFKLIIFNIQSSSLIDSLDAVKDEDNRYPHFSPDGNQILFSNYKRGIWVVNANGTDLRNILPQTSQLRVEQPTWHPDGNHIVYSHFKITKTRNGAIGLETEGYLSLYKLKIN